MYIIPLEKEKVPYQFDITLDKQLYTLKLYYNLSFDFFTMDLIKGDTILVSQEKLVLKQFLFRDCYEDKDHNLNPNFPSGLFYVGTTDNTIKRVSYTNLADTVQLYYIERDELNEQIT